MLAATLTEAIRAHAAEIVGAPELQQLLDDYRKHGADRYRAVVPEKLREEEVHVIFRGLLRERVPIANLDLIFQALLRHAATGGPAVADQEGAPGDGAAAVGTARRSGRPESGVHAGSRPRGRSGGPSDLQRRRSQSPSALRCGRGRWSFWAPAFSTCCGSDATRSCSANPP